MSSDDSDDEELARLKGKAPVRTAMRVPYSCPVGDGLLCPCLYFSALFLVLGSSPLVWADDIQGERRRCGCRGGSEEEATASGSAETTRRAHGHMREAAACYLEAVASLECSGNTDSP